MKKIFALTGSVLAISTGIIAQEANPPSVFNSPSQAQQTQAPPAQQAQPQQPQPDYLRSEHQDWFIACSPAQGNQCFMVQRVNTPQGNPLLEVNLIPAEIEGEPDAVMGATITVPVNVLLPRGLYLEVDGKLPDDPYEYQFCNAGGCYVRFPVTASQINDYKKATDMKVALFHIQNPSENIEIPISLMGFTDAYNTLMKIESGELSPEPVAQAPAAPAPEAEAAPAEPAAN